MVRGGFSVHSRNKVREGETAILGEVDMEWRECPAVL